MRLCMDGVFRLANRGSAIAKNAVIGKTSKAAETIGMVSATNTR